MSSINRTCTWAITAVVAGAMFTIHAAEGTATSSGEKQYLPWEKGSVLFGGFIAAFDSELGFGVNNAAGVTINAEELFGLDSTLSLWRAEAMYRPGKSLRHQLDLMYASYHRSGSGSLSEEIDINGNPYPIGAQMKSVFNFDIIRGTYSYAILQDERMRIAVGLGIYAVPLEYSVSLTTARGRTAVEGADTTLPLPTLALRGEFQLIPKLFLNTSIDAMYLEISDFKGSMIDVNVGLEYRPWKHFGFGVGYNAMSVSVEGESSGSSYPGIDFVGSVDVRYAGLFLYAKLSF